MEIIMKKSYTYILFTATLLAASGLFSSCEKVSPQGVLLGNTSVDDRVKQSMLFYTYHGDDMDWYLVDSIEEYSFLVGSDSHITFDPGRLSEMMQTGIENDDLFYCHLGDLADTKPEYYYNTKLALYDAKRMWKSKYLRPLIDEYHSEADGVYIDDRVIKEWKNNCRVWDDWNLPFYPVVGNHDITHNGWTLFCDQFKTSFYEFTVKVGGQYDRFIFLDSANGTLGNYQIDKIEDNAFHNDGKEIRNTFVFTHTNIFRPSLNEFASTYCREELYYILNKLSEWNTTIMFYGHVHAWDDRYFGECPNGKMVRHITMPSMNFVDHPNGGDDLLVRVTVKKDGSCQVDRIGLHCKERTKQELDELGYYTKTK
jgi:hypothetical protein